MSQWCWPAVFSWAIFLVGCADPGSSLSQEKPNDRGAPEESRPSLSGAEGLFRIRVEDRRYDLHRPHGATTLVIEVSDWPGNEFGLWLPEHVWVNGDYVWTNWQEADFLQNWTRRPDGTLEWKKAFEGVTLTTTLTPDHTNNCLWFRHAFRNESDAPLHELNADACFQLVNAPQFISVEGERYWACLDDEWTTTDRVPRHQSPDPRRVSFLRKGLRDERTVVPSLTFPHALMPEAASHPLFVAESFGQNASVGIAARHFEKLFNNNDSILRCLHSNSAPIDRLEPGETQDLEGVIVFGKGDHALARNQFATITAGRWK